MFKRFIKIFAILTALCAICCGAQAAQVLEGGAAGETVMVLTRRLVELGFMSESVSQYDERVISAVADFQTANGLERTGIADIPTQQMMQSQNAVTRAEYINGFATMYDGVSVTVGAQGDDVALMQERLVELGYYDFYVDGKFGEGTRRAVVNFQRANGLESTGIADESFFLRLYYGDSVSYGDFVMNQCAVKGDNGNNVRAIQLRLTELGYFNGEPSGNYGENTARAVTRFQFDNDIDQTGNVNEETYEALFSASAAMAADDGSLYPGDTGDDVRAMQHQLSLMGFYRHTPEGEYDYCTETAVMLFRAANGLPLSENADLEVLALLYSGSANDASALYGTADDITADTRARVCEHALSCAGYNYADSGEEYPGIGFIRHLYAHEGVDIGDVSHAAANIRNASEVAADMSTGDVVVFSRKRNGVDMTSFAICIGGGNVAWANDITGIVEIVPLATIDYTGIYVWKVGK